MTDNSHRHYEALFHAYELGMLDDDERRELEEHLTECDRCFEKMSQLQEAAALLRHDRDIRKAVGDIEAGFDREKAPTKTRWSRLWPAYAAAVLLIILILKPWKIEISPDQEAVAAANRLAIVRFENIADPGDSLRWGQMLAHLLTSDLAELPSLQIVSEQRLIDAFSSLKLEDTKPLDHRQAIEIGKRTDARLLLTGQIMQDSAHVAVNSQILDIRDGSVKAAQQITMPRETDLFTLVDSLSVRIREDLSLPEFPAPALDPPVADITTHSLEALRHFQNGCDHFYRGAMIPAEESFLLALASDSTMPMAYYYLSFLRGGWETEKTIDKAMQFAARAGWREKYLIRSRAAQIKGNYAEAITELMKLVERVPDDKNAYYRLGMYNLNLSLRTEAIRYFDGALEIDSTFSLALSALASTYARTGQFDSAMKTTDRYIALKPEEPWPYTLKSTVLAENGRLEDAVAAVKVALDKDPHSFEALHFISLLYLMQDKLDSAEGYLDRMAADSNIFVKESGHLYLTYLPVLRGDLIKALNLLESDSALHMEAVRNGAFPYDYLLRAMLYEELGDTLKALDIIIAAEKIIAEYYPDNKITWDYYTIQLLSGLGRFDDAQQRLSQLDSILKIREQTDRYQHHYGAGAITLARRDYRQAINEFEQACRLMPNDVFYICYMLGRAYFEAGRYVDAVEAFERQLNSVNSYRFFHSVWLVKAYYYLGESYDNLSQKDQAVKYYEKFLHHWGNRNPHTPLIDRARERLSILGKSDQPNP